MVDFALKIENAPRIGLSAELIIYFFGEIIMNRDFVTDEINRRLKYVTECINALKCAKEAIPREGKVAGLPASRSTACVMY